MKLNDLKEASMAGALLTQLGKKLNPFDKSGESQMSVKDRMKQQQFVQDFIGRVSTNLAQGIQGGLINPDPQAKGSAPGAGGAPGGASGPAPAPVPPKPGAPAPAPGGAGGPAPAPVPPKPGAPKPVPPKPGAPAPGGAGGPAPAPVPPKPGEPAGAPAAGAAAPAAKLDPRAAGAKSRAMLQQRTFNRATKEGTYNQLDAILESVIELGEEAQQYPYTISSYLENFLKQYMKGANTAPLKSMVDAVQATYAQDKGKKALENLASAAYSLYWAGGAGVNADQKAAGTAPAPTSVGDAIAQGLKQGLGQQQSGAQAASGTGTTTAAGGAAAGPSTPEKVKSVYAQAKELIKSLNKQQKGWILNKLEKEIGATPSTKPASTAPTSTTPDVSRGAKIKQKTKPTAPVATPSAAPATAPAAVAESKKYKFWGKK